MRSAVSVLLFGAVIAVAAQPTIPPTTTSFQKTTSTLGEVAAELSKTPAGVTVNVAPQLLKAKCPAAFAKTPFWEALETAADHTKTQLVIRDGGKTVVLEPRPKGRELSSVSGPFRVVPRSVSAKLLLDSDTAEHTVHLEVHWEPGMPVFRLDTHPTITKATDDRGTALLARKGSAHQYPASALTDMTVKLTGLTRDSRKIGVLAGEFRATAAEKMLPFSFAPAGGQLPAQQTLDRVTTTFRRVQKEGDTWEVDLDVLYPEGQPVFESFEEQRWLRDNRLRLTAPGKSFDPENEEVSASGRRVTATYRFKGDVNPLAKGWVLTYETPAPLVEVKVPFELRGIPLP